MAPNVYASVTVIQPHAQTINDMPMRLYGIIPVMVEDPAYTSGTGDLDAGPDKVAAEIRDKGKRGKKETDDLYDSCC